MNGTRMMKRNNWTARVLGALLIGLLTVSVAAAASLSQAKADGWIGEQANGYIGLVRQDAPGDVKALVRDVNARRKAGYQDIAKRQGTSVSDVEKVGGNKAIQKTKKGNYVRAAGGGWRRK